MKFYRSYTYQVYDINETIPIILFCLLGLACSYVMITMSELFFRSMGFVILILVLIAFSGCSPYGRGSIYLDRQILRVVPMSMFFKYILPREREYSLNKELSINVNLSMEYMLLRQDQQLRTVKLNGLSKNSKRKLINLLKVLANNRQYIRLEIHKVLLDDKNLKFAPDEVMDYPYLFEIGETISFNILAGSSKKFDIQLFRKLNSPEMKNPEPYIFPLQNDDSVQRIQWMISNSGAYRLVVRNKSISSIRRIRFNLIQDNKFGHIPPKNGV